jgi:hypothetical protein
VPRSGLLIVLSQQTALEFHGWQVAERRVQTLLVVNLFQEDADTRLGLGQIAIFSPVVE